MTRHSDAIAALAAAVNDDDDSLKRHRPDPVFTTVADFEKPNRMRLVSGGFDKTTMRKLKIEVASEHGLTQRGILNVLLAEWVALPVSKRRRVKDLALAWEKAQWPWP